MATSYTSDPFQAGRTIYSAKQSALIAIPPNGGAAEFTEVVFSSAAVPPYYSISTGASLPAGDYNSIVSVAVLDDPEILQQQIALLRQSDGSLSLERFYHAGTAGKLSSDTIRLPPISNPKIAGMIRNYDDNSRRYLIAGYDGQTVSIWSLSFESGQQADKWDLPLTCPGSPVAAALIRRKMASYLVLLFISNGDLTAAALPTSALQAGSPFDGSSLIEISVSSEVDPISVQVTAARMLSSTSDQQLVVCCAAASGNANLFVLSFGSQAVDQTVSLSTAFPPDRNAFRIAAADLNGDGLDEIVIAWPATCGGIAGCAAFALFAADATTGTLSKSSEYVTAAPGLQALASVDLWISAGLFGDAGALGILVIASGASTQDLFSGTTADIFVGVVPVNAATNGLPQPSNLPAVLDGVVSLGKTTLTAPGIYGLAADLTGLSVVLGQPTIQSIPTKNQIMALICCPPYQANVMSQRPTIAFSTTQQTVRGLIVSSNQMWSFSKDVALNLGVEGQTLTNNVSNTYGIGFDKNDDSSVSTEVQLSATSSDQDMLLIVGNDYTVWEYPVYRKYKDAQPSGTLLVIFPSSEPPHQAVVSAFDPSYGYSTRSEAGCLLSYFGLTLDGHDSSSDVFPSQELEITDDMQGNLGITFNWTNTQSQTESKSTTLHNTTSDSAHFAASTALFAYLPVTFGLNLTTSESYSDNELQTSSLVLTNTIVITLQSGPVSDVEYDYNITAYVYFHNVLGCLTVAYDVALSGKGWDNFYQSALPMLIKPFRTSIDLVLGAFSRSVSFPVNPSTQKVTIAVEIFNCSLGSSVTAYCACYEGLPIVTPGVPATDSTPGTPQTLTLPSKQIGVTKSIDIAATGRGPVSFDWDTPVENQAITVAVWGGSVLPGCPEIGWNVYPQSAFSTMPIQ